MRQLENAQAAVIDGIRRQFLMTLLFIDEPSSLHITSLAQILSAPEGTVYVRYPMSYILAPNKVN